MKNSLHAWEFACQLGIIPLLLLSSSLPSPAATLFPSTLQEISPTPTTFVFGVDQTSFQSVSAPTAFGTATGFLDLVLNFGCNASDFSSFPSGDIALILRSPTCSFATKGINAENAGAIAFIVFDDLVEPLPGVGFVSSSPTIPGVFVTNAVGLNFETALLSGPVSVTLAVVPEPASLGICAFGLILGLMAKRVQRSRAARRWR